MSQIQAFDFSVDLLRALLWQYNDAARLEGLLQQKQSWYNANQKSFWEDWVADVFDLRTANDFGLSVWAIILNMQLALGSQGDLPDKKVWGFGQYRENFTNGNFTSNSSSTLTTEQKRLILRLRYFQLVSRGTVPEINAFLAYLLVEFGTCFVSDSGDMQAVYVFAEPPGAQVETVLTEYDLLPRPAGVKVKYVIQGPEDGFGFGIYHENFLNGNFHHA